MHAIRSLVAALLAAFSLLAPNATATPWYGVNDASVTGRQATALQSATFARELNATSSRLTFNWAWLQPTDSAPNFSLLDSIYAADLSAGIRPLIQITGSPSWATSAGAACPRIQCNYPPSPGHYDAWQALLRDIAQRYPLAVGIEIWNEPNMSWSWGGGIDPGRYTRLLQLAYGAIKAVDPQMPVVAGALATDLGTATTSSAEPLAAYLRAMYQDGARGYMDGISIHPYPSALDLFYTFRAIALTTEIRDLYGDRSPLWITETGLSAQEFTGTQQAEVDSELLRALMPYPGIAGVYLSTMVEPAAGGQGLGLLTPSLAATPAFCSLAVAAASAFRCPGAITTPTPRVAQSGRWNAQVLLQAAVNVAIAYHAAHGTYAGLDSATLAALDPRLSPAPADGTAAGRAANPGRIMLLPLSPSSVLLCNASTAGMSYCAGSRYLAGWTWSAASGSAMDAASAFLYPRRGATDQGDTPSAPVAAVSKPHSQPAPARHLRHVRRSFTVCRRGRRPRRPTHASHHAPHSTGADAADRSARCRARSGRRRARR